MCFPGDGTQITKDMCFPNGGIHITRDMCFAGGEHKSLGRCVSQVGENEKTKTLMLTVYRHQQRRQHKKL